MNMMNNSFLVIENIVKYFMYKKSFFSQNIRYIKAVDGVSFKLERRNDSLAIVGESGSGKTTLGRIICRLIEPTSGTIMIEGKNIQEYSRIEYAKLCQPVFQDPYSSLNPWKKIKSIISLPFKIHGIPFNEDVLTELLEKVGLSRDFLERYPHELSGGQRQRIVIARALAVKPKLVVADEPVSGLDVTIQAQIIDLLRKLQKQENMAYIIISHDLNLVRRLCNKVVVMYLGKICEMGSLETIMKKPLHPYTKSLLASYPTCDPLSRDWVESPPLKGEIPSPADPPSGCRFRTRCPLAQEMCSKKTPQLMEVEKEHYVACPVVLGGWNS